MKWTLRIAAMSICFLMLSRATAAAGSGTTPTTPTTQNSVAWRTAGITSSQALPLTRYTADGGIKADASGESLKLSLASREGPRFSYVELNDRPDYTQVGVARIDVTQITGGVWTLQAVAYDANGTAVNFVDLIDNVDSPGAYEVPMKIYRTPMKDAKRVGLRIWIAGGDPKATIGGVWWGVVGK